MTVISLLPDHRPLCATINISGSKKKKKRGEGAGVVNSRFMGHMEISEKQTKNRTIAFSDLPIQAVVGNRHLLFNEVE